jgi:hypothetical protein
LTKIRVIGLVGMSFSGSTVLNYVLGSHPGVYGGSELYRLIDTDPAKRCGCSWCHEGCAVLTPERIATLNKENIYTSLARFTQKESVVDTSKNLPWFEDVFPRQNAEEVSPSMIVLSKHPLRQLAAYMGWEQNYLYRCGLRSVLKRAFLDPATALSRERMHLSYWLDVMGEFYSAIDRSRMLRGMPRWNVRYEDFVTGTAQSSTEWAATTESCAWPPPRRGKNAFAPGARTISWSSTTTAPDSCSTTRTGTRFRNAPSPGSWTTQNTAPCAKDSAMTNMRPEL